jgi:hypothetical protein
VIGADIDQRRLIEIEQIKASYLSEGVYPSADPSAKVGQIFTVCTNLKPELWPFNPSGGRLSRPSFEFILQ